MRVQIILSIVILFTGSDILAQDPNPSNIDFSSLNSEEAPDIPSIDKLPVYIPDAWKTYHNNGQVRSIGETNNGQKFSKCETLCCILLLSIVAVY